MYNICSVSFLQWQLLPLKNLVATICGQFLFFFCGVVQPHLLITYSCKCIKPDCVFIYFLFNTVGVTDLVSVLGDSSYC